MTIIFIQVCQQPVPMPNPHNTNYELFNHIRWDKYVRYYQSMLNIK